MATKQRETESTLALGHQALADHRWQDAFELLSRADREMDLGAEDLEALALAAWFSAQADLAIEAKERAFKAFLDRDDRIRAAALAFDITREYAFKQQMSIASAWAGRPPTPSRCGSAIPIAMRWNTRSPGAAAPAMRARPRRGPRW